MKKTGILLLLFAGLWPGPVFSYQTFDFNNGGVVAGTVKFSGVIPDLPRIRVVKNTDICGKEVFDPVLSVHPGNDGLKNVVLFLEGVERGKAMPPGQTINSFKCLFVPYASVLSKEGSVVFHNNDPILHNVHAYNAEGATLFNVALPGAGRAVKRSVKGKGMIHLQCDNHVHMNGWAMVLDHPYFSVSDDQGRFKIRDIPPGKYTLVAWHPGYHMVNRAEYEASLGTETLVRPVYDDPNIISKTVEVKENAETRLDLAIEGR